MEFEVLIPAADLEDEAAMGKHRAFLDAGAKAHHPRKAFLSEEVLPHTVTLRDPKGKLKEQPETAETKQWRVLRRHYGTKQKQKE